MKIVNIRRLRRFRLSCCAATWLIVGGSCLLATPSFADEGASAEAHAEDDHDHGHAEEGHGEAHAGDPDPLAIDVDLALCTGIVFLTLLGVLGKFAWPAIVKALDEREQKIADNIAAAAAKHEEAKALLAAHEAKLANAADEVRELLEEARRDAEHTKGQIIDEAKKAAAEEATRAVREVAQAKDAALHEMAESSANLAIDLASKVIREQLNPERQTEIVREALSKLTSATPSDN